jgi:hypothetical protein
MRHVTLGGFDKVGDQVVTAFELDIDLSERVLESILQRDQIVVQANEVHQEENNDGPNGKQSNHKSGHSRYLLLSLYTKWDANWFTAQIKAIAMIVMDSDTTVDQADSRMIAGAGVKKKKFLFVRAQLGQERKAIEPGCNPD